MTRLTIICISCIIVSLMFAGQSYAQIDPETVLGVWLLDEGKGDITEDASGNGNDGTLMSAPAWIAGVSGSALDFSGSSSYVDCGNAEALNVGVFSVSFWCNIPSTQGWNHMISRGQHGASGTPGSVNWGVMMYDAQETILFETFNDTAWTGITASTSTGEWHHVVATYDGDTMQLYHDGALADTTSGTGILLDQSRAFLIGARSDAGSAGGFFTGSIDEVGYFSTILAPEDIETIMNDGLAGIIGGQPLARRPDPKDGALLEQTWGTLSWSPGDFAVSHDVYLGDNFDDVNNGNPETFQGNLPSTYFMVGFLGFPYPEGLVPGTTYYWRIDEVNDTDPNSPWKGDVWSFTVPPKTAYDPDPADGIKFVDPEVELGWTAGFLAKLHYVYFGDNFDDVNSANIGIPSALNTFTPPGTLELDKNYYWRVDEFDGFATYKGDVWSFSTIPDIAITDPSLIGWWKLDEGYGTTAVDWSGHGNHGTFVGDPQWVAGYDEDALEFDGSGDFLDCGADPSLGISGAVSITAWIKVGAQGIAHKVGGNQDGSNGGYKMSMYSNNRIEFEIRTSDNTAILNRDIAGGTEIVADVWYHVAGIYSQADGYIRTYVNGVLDRQLITTEALGASPGTFYIGCEPYSTGSDNFNGVIDNVRLYNKALTPEEIQQAMRGDPLLAGLPKPSNGSTPYIRDATPLSWSPGDNASGHDVYFGTDKEAVADADESDTTGIYRGRQGITIYTPPDVEWGGGPYYWRIDEYNTDATISKGNVWSFTVIDFIGIDDIEDYNDYPPDEIFSTWIDGWEVPTNGSIAGHANPPFAETSIVHGGSQSMPVYYENNFKYSEITMTLVSVRDWTEEGVGVLSLWFRGNPAGFVEGLAGTYTMSAAGTDIWNDADEFRYAYKQLSGDGSITATVESVLWVPGSDDWTKAGVMIRDTLDAGSKNAFVALTTGSGDGATFQWRPIAGGSSSSNRTLVGISPPSAIRLVRQGNTFTGYVFLNGQWQQEGQSATVAMADPVYIGLALTSHSSGVTTEAEFSDVLTTGAVTPLTWTHEAIGAAMAANDPAPMYVNLNGIATVYHDNPDAVLIEEWTQWTIDLSAPGGFAAQGVNLANVNTISIGFGDKNNLQAGGSGMVFFDDIRLYRPAPEPEPAP